MIRWSVLIGIFGIIGTAGALTYLIRRDFHQVAEYSWLVGLAALAPAWLMGILAILGRSPVEVTDTPLPRSVLFSSAAALLGVIFTDLLNRRLQAKGVTPRWKALWFLGVVSFIPAWMIALWVLK